MRIPVELRGAATVVHAATGLPRPELVFANSRDHGYFLLLLDSASITALEGGALARVHDAFLRAMLWGALWDQVRGYRMAPERFIRLALRELPRETDEQIVPVILGRLDRAVGAYLLPAARDRVQTEVERVLWAGAADTTRPYGVRKAYVDAFIGLAASADGLARLEGLLSADSVAGEPLRDPTRWDIVTRLLELGAPSAEARYAAQERRDTTADGRRRAFVAAAGRPSAEIKREYFRRWFADSSLNEDWASGSLWPFNTLEQDSLSFPYVGPALDSLPFIQAHRRIFFLGDLARGVPARADGGFGARGRPGLPEGAPAPAGRSSAEGAAAHGRARADGSDSRRLDRGLARLSRSGVPWWSRTNGGAGGRTEVPPPCPPRAAARAAPPP